ncbi:MAG: diguanylate cyclase [Leptolyngbya sp. SIO1E4]|nr:diguanylate cyclase [Leptolyngbya sp. SIO1E4]
MSASSARSLEEAIDRQPPIATPETPIKTALLQMQTAASSYILVAKAANRFVSLVTEQNLLRTLITHRHASDVPLAAVISPQVAAAHINQISDLLAARDWLQQHKIHHLPLIDDHHSIIGTLTHETLVRFLNPVDLLRLQRVEDVMTSQVICASPKTAALDLSKLLIRHQVSCIVIGETTAPECFRPLGVVTEQDIIHLWCHEKTLERCAQDIMTQPPQCILPTAPLWQAHQQMTTHHRRHLVVINSAGILMGIVTQTHLLQKVDPAEAELTLDVLDHIIHKRTTTLNQANQKLQRKIQERKRAKEALQHQIARERLVSRITQHIRQSFDLETILATTVAEVSEFVKADRTLIYRVPHGIHTAGNVMAEEVANGCDRIQGNAGLEAILSQLDTRFYASGRVHSVPDLQAVDRSSRKARFLRYLGIQATLFAPILVKDTLWGLLILNQHAAPRRWEKLEINLLEQLASQVGLAIQQATLYAQLAFANQQLQEQANVDGLTQIANRRRFDDCLQQEWRRLAREQQPLSLILCDVDYFKRYNDTYGHQAGDGCLKAVAQALGQAIRRPADVVARYGGEEFAIILPNTPLAGVCHVAEQARLKVEALQMPHSNSQVSDWVTLSLGVASYVPHCQDSPESLIKAADSALYQAKASGRNCWSSSSATADSAVNV